jgi:hypothetical protein
MTELGPENWALEINLVLTKSEINFPKKPTYPELLTDLAWPTAVQ